MKLDLTQNIIGPDGKAFTQTEDERWTLRTVFIHALGQAPLADKSLTASFERYDLAVKIRKAKTIQLNIDEAKMVQDCIIKTFPPFMVAAAARMLEGVCGEDEEEVVTRKKSKIKRKNK